MLDGLKEAWETVAANDRDAHISKTPAAGRQGKNVPTGCGMRHGPAASGGFDSHLLAAPDGFGTAAGRGTAITAGLR